MKRILVKNKTFFALIIVFFILSCNKNENTSYNQTLEIEKWQFIDVQEPAYSDFFEDKNGNVAIRFRQSVYLFNNDGKLKNITSIPTTNISDFSFGFMNDGSVYTVLRSTNSNAGDFLLLYKMRPDFSYFNPLMVDIRKFDSTGTFTTGEYQIFDIAPANHSTASNANSVLVYAYKYPDARKKILNKDGVPVIIQTNTNSPTVAENLLPINTWLTGISSIRNNIALYGAQGTLILNNAFEPKGEHRAFKIFPKINYLNNFITLMNDAYYISNDGLQLTKKLDSIGKSAVIFDVRDSLLFIKDESGLKSVNGITGKVENRFDINDKRMPVNLDTLAVNGFYVSRNKISYLITTLGILIAN
ncbi:MAG: hypothetical protein ACK4K9_00780 [Bacteroidia bacterium]